MRLQRQLNSFGTIAMAVVLLLSVPASVHADAARDKQWALQAFKVQQNVWPLSRGKGVTVAVIDGPIRESHIDLLNQLLPSRSFGISSSFSDRGHGTLVASLIAAHGHGPGNSDGIMGLAPEVKILPLAVDVASSSSYREIGDAIRYAVDHGAGVINISLAGASKDPYEQSGVSYAEARDVVVVAGSGNDGAGMLGYPAGFPGVIAVGGANQDGRIWDGSNYGPGMVLVAPAVGILGDDNGTDTEYALGDGTSLATAYVSAAAALVRSKYPKLTAGQVINRLIKTAANPNAKPGQTTPDPHYGYGVVRPDAALSADVDAGPAEGPLPQAVDPLAVGAKAAVDSGRAAASGSGGGMGVAAVLGVVAVVGAGLVAAAMLFLRGRRRARDTAGATGEDR